MKKFDMNCKQFFLTYPKRGALNSKEIVLENVKVIVGCIKANIKHIVVSYETGQEEHDSKSYEHFHVIVKLDRVARIRNPEFWDVMGVHGHYKSVDKARGSWLRVMQYVKKDGDYLEEIDRTPEVEHVPVRASSESSLLSYLIGEGRKLGREVKGSDVRAIMEALGDDALGIYYWKEKRFLDGLKSALQGKSLVGKVVFDRCQFYLPKEVLDWESQKQKLSLVIRGKSGTGKTAMAKSLFKNPLMVSSREGLRELREEHDGVIFDDMCLKELIAEERIHLLDVENDRDVRVKYGYVVLPEGLPRVFTSNALWLSDWLGIVDEEVGKACKRRLIDCYVVNDLRVIREE